MTKEQEVMTENAPTGIVGPKAIGMSKRRKVAIIGGALIIGGLAVYAAPKILANMRAGAATKTIIDSMVKAAV